ncbi:hypothetical protein GGD63_006564 [Bradyrhizobium sp. cir1]|uniref:hypothetical protein n=1 Tax=Bradyrhizobium sp. cir1 TaxID=1445730 RepID=UPI0016063D84|nr:hypothetical protein [Bradyrhizobium sp. cir1]MBB4373736.1 hypothetical protein [Bradyrhizobium sp. cir1]
MILEAIDYLERGFEFISKTLRNPQNAARELLAADFCTVSNFFFEVAYSFADLCSENVLGIIRLRPD